MILFIFIVLAVIAAAIFAKMTLYVAGALLGVLIVLIVYFIKRRKQS